VTSIVIRGEAMRILVLRKKHVYISGAVVALLIIGGLVLWLK